MTVAVTGTATDATGATQTITLTFGPATGPPVNIKPPELRLKPPDLR